MCWLWTEREFRFLAANFSWNITAAAAGVACVGSVNAVLKMRSAVGNLMELFCWGPRQGQGSTE